MGFDKIFKFTLQWEGGSKLTNDPDDPGKTTKWGLSAVANPDLDIPNLTESEAKEIYRIRYWDKVARGDDDNLDMASFDTAVNVGVGRVNKWLNSCYTASALLYERRKHYFVIVNNSPKLGKYTKGWENRVVALEKFLKDNT